MMVLLAAGTTMIGALPLLTGVLLVRGIAVLLVVLVSPATGAVVALNTGCVPTVLALGVAGTLKPLLPLALIGPGLTQVTMLLLVVQTQPLLLKLAGAVTPVGKVTVVVMGPRVGPLPLLVTVTGTLLACPTTKAGEGCPIVVVRSETAQLATTPSGPA